mmetsp:Transcript_19765/g.49728  ORF Transcript_19765/g.49728 Transcript_19765/m.49728 type:complete len:294 (-) Transcript_19765:1593-2474(-)
MVLDFDQALHVAVLQLRVDPGIRRLRVLVQRLHRGGDEVHHQRARVVVRAVLRRGHRAREERGAADLVLLLVVSLQVHLDLVLALLGRVHHFVLPGVVIDELERSVLELPLGGLLVPLLVDRDLLVHVDAELVRTARSVLPQLVDGLDREPVRLPRLLVLLQTGTVAKRLVRNRVQEVLVLHHRGGEVSDSDCESDFAVFRADGLHHVGGVALDQFVVDDDALGLRVELGRDEADHHLPVRGFESDPADLHLLAARDRSQVRLDRDHRVRGAHDGTHVYLPHVVQPLVRPPPE